MTRRGQVTLFIMLGIVLLISLLFFLLLRSRIVAPLMQNQQEDITLPTLIKKGIQETIDGCLQHAGQQALLLAGRQGGAIYQYQAEGTALAYSPSKVPYAEWFFPLAEDNVSFGIIRSDPPPPPLYPFAGPLGSSSAEGVLGKPSLTRLCDSDGPNTWNQSGAQYTCISYDLSGSPHSLQEYAEAYALREALSCINLSELEHKYGVTITVSGEPRVDALLGDTDVLFNLHYPLLVKGSAETKFDVFSYTANVRLKKIYELAYRLIEKDTQDFTFAVNDPSSLARLRTCPSSDRFNVNEDCVKEGMNVTLLDAPCQVSRLCLKNAFADIIRIEDTHSSLFGRPFVFQFARENRRPALDLMDESEMSGAYRAYLQEKYGLSGDQRNPYLKSGRNPYPQHYNILLTEGDTLQFFPYGLDPDEDKLTYDYSGWKTPTPLPGGEALLDPFFGTPLDPGATGGGGGFNYWEAISPLFQQTRKDTSYKTAHNDVGLKVVRVTVRDPEGFEDWQDVRILVNDRPDFSLAVSGSCSAGYLLHLSCKDRYFPPYRVEVFDDQNICFNETSYSCSREIHYGYPGGPCGDAVPRQLTVQLSDDFGASTQRGFSACSQTAQS